MLGTTNEQQTFFCYLTLMMVYAGKMNFYSKKWFPDYYMKGWVEKIEDNDIDDLIIYVTSS